MRLDRRSGCASRNHQLACSLWHSRSGARCPVCPAQSSSRARRSSEHLTPVPSVWGDSGLSRDGGRRFRRADRLGNRRRRGGDGRGIIVAEERRDRGRHLRLGHGGGVLARHRAGVSGPRTPIQMASEPSVFAPWSRQPRGGSPRPSIGHDQGGRPPRYSGHDCSSSQRCIRSASKSCGGLEVLVVAAAVGILRRCPQN